MTRPTVLPDWATNANFGAGARPWNGQPNKAQPSAGMIAEGFDPENPLYADFLNWALNNHALWIDFYDLLLNGASPTTSVDVAQLMIKDSAGNARYLIDHLGFPGGSIDVWNEGWRAPFSFSGAAGITQITANPAWSYSIVGAVNPLATAITSGLGFMNVNIAPLTTLNNKVLICSSQQLTQLAGPVSWVFETEVEVDLGTQNNGMTFTVGLSGAQDPSSPAGGFVWIQKANGNTNWQCQTNDGAATTTVDSGVAPPGGTYQRFRIELHGTSTPYGASTARFFIQDVRVASITTNIPAGSLYLAAEALTTGNPSTAHNMRIGPVRLKSNRYAVGGTV